jgi:hypothetical protein
MSEYGELSMAESSNGSVVKLCDFVVLGPAKGMNEEGAEERPGGKGMEAKVTLVALLIGLDEPPATEPEAAATGSGGFGNANDSEGEKGRTDMGVGTCRSGSALFR